MHAALRYREALAPRQGEIVELTRQLVEIESPTDHHPGVEAVGAAIAERLERAGAVVRRVPLEGCAPLLDAALKLGDGVRVLVLGHADTLWPLRTLDGWPFVAHGDGRLTGPGVGDMKACLASATVAFDALAADPPAGVGSIRLLLVPDEETGSTRSRRLIEDASRGAGACLTLEAARADGSVVTSRGAVGAMVVRARGRAQHVTDPGPHANALVPLLQLGQEIEALPGASVGILRAGTARQIVPGEGEIHVDLRAATTEDAESLAERVRGLAEAASVAGVVVTADGGVTRPAWPPSPGADALFAAAASAAEALGIATRAIAERGGSDASFAGALGVPTLDGLGPPCTGSCSRDEAVRSDDLVPWAAILCSVIASAAGRGA